MNRLFAAVLFAVLILSVGCSGRDGKDEPTVTTSPASPGATASAVTGTATVAATATRGAALPKGVSHATLTSGGLERTYRLFVPSNAKASDKLPLVIGLHGGLGWGDQFAANSNFETLAEAEGFIVAFPDGTNRTWNAGSCCGQASSKNIDDVDFLASLIQHLAATLPVDGNRIYMTGHSNGGMMSFRFGCERPDLVRGVAPVAGSLELPKCQPTRGTSLLAIHGDADQNHPIEGGEGDRSIAGVPFVSMDDSLSRWTGGMQCEANPSHSTSGALTTTLWKGCRDGATATFIVIADADHPWPGGVARAGVQDRVSDKLEATLAVWSFFKTLR